MNFSTTLNQTSRPSYHFSHIPEAGNHDRYKLALGFGDFTDNLCFSIIFTRALHSTSTKEIWTIEVFVWNEDNEWEIICNDDFDNLDDDEEHFMIAARDADDFTCCEMEEVVTEATELFTTIIASVQLD
jgi:hypothetical protein